MERLRLARACVVSRAVGARATLPERLSWRLSPWSLVVGQLDLKVTHPSALSQPLAVRAPLLGSGSATLSATTLRLPASLLIGVGAPWNTIGPAASCS